MYLCRELAKMQYTGIWIDKDELLEYGRKIKLEIDERTEKIYRLCGQEFNINSTKQLGKVLFEDLKLPVQKKKKSGYSTDVEVLEKLRGEHPVIDEILNYRQLVKLNSTYVEGMLPFINEKTGRIHSYFHQTVTATGRISSAEPNLQNIPTRFELGRQLRKVFKPKEGCVFVDADYSQIELRVFAHISGDKNMIKAFKDGVDIHREVASKVFGKALDEITSEERTKAKAVNFGIVYGISDFGLGEQLGINRKEAKGYIDEYLDKYKRYKRIYGKNR
ncbi:MAG: DNA polymerase I, partial [Clostridia bacterium]|nr:DNA polymerase I [Clostridia bacterium]